MIFRGRARAGPEVDHGDLAAAEDVPIHYAGESAASSIGRGKEEESLVKDDAAWGILPNST